MRSIAAWIVATLLLNGSGIAAGQTGRDLKLERTPVSGSTLPDGRTRWALVVGISKYRNVPPGAQLKFANRDAEGFAKFLQSPRGGGLSAAQIQVLTDSNATLGAIRSALHTWLPQTVKPNDIVYIFFAGHGVVAEKGEGYFVAHDSDPQNLHATGLAFREVDQVLHGKLRAGLVVLFADACHSGGIGWSDDLAAPSRAQVALEAIGSRDRSVLKLLASRPSEQSFEDERWDGGHGVFTYALLRGLNGEAERDRDGVVTASELTDFVSALVPKETGSKQNPRVAGNFEARLALGFLRDGPNRSEPATLTVHGLPGASIYIDSRYYGSTRSSGDLQIAELTAGARRFSMDLPEEGTFEFTGTLAPGNNVLDLSRFRALTSARIQSLVRRGRVFEPGGALELYKSSSFDAADRAQAEAAIAAGLEDIGQQCVSDYVQSTAGGLKGTMLRRSAEAYRVLATLRPGDQSIVMKEKFCTARAEIASGHFAAAVDNLQASLAIDADFACAYNALGVAFTRLNRITEATRAFEKARDLTPAWSLPLLSLAQQHLSSGNPAKAIPYLEQAARLNPKSMQIQWTLMRVYRLAGRPADFERQSAVALTLDPNYAPAYLEIGLFRESRQEQNAAAQAFDTYLTLAPNYADSGQVRAKVERLRVRSSPPAPKPPSLLRRNEVKK